MKSSVNFCVYLQLRESFPVLDWLSLIHDEFLLTMILSVSYLLCNSELLSAGFVIIAQFSAFEHLVEAVCLAFIALAFWVLDWWWFV